VAAATFTAFFTPWQLAFGSDAADFYGDPAHSPEAWAEAALALVWACDIAASFLVGPDAGDVSSSSSSSSSGPGAAATGSSSTAAALPLPPTSSSSPAPLRSLERRSTMVLPPSSTPAPPSNFNSSSSQTTTATSSAPSLVAANYGRSSTFFLDVVSVVPWDFLAVALAGGASAAVSAGLLPGLSLLRLATLGRLHRVRAAFAQLEYDTRLDLLWVTIARNTALVALAAHAAACGFYFAARASGFDAEALVGADRDFLLSLDGGQRYLMSLWWALSTLSSGEYGNPSPLSIEATKAAAARTALFLAFQIALWSYILGTTTLLVVKSDERTGRFRDRSARLRDFAARSGVPAELERSMDDHLKLYFANEEASDEAVLAVMPSAIRKKVLRHLFGTAIKVRGRKKDWFLFFVEIFFSQPFFALFSSLLKNKQTNKPPQRSASCSRAPRAGSATRSWPRRASSCSCRRSTSFRRGTPSTRSTS